MSFTKEFLGAAIAAHEKPSYPYDDLKTIVVVKRKEPNRPGTVADTCNPSYSGS